SCAAIRSSAFGLVMYVGLASPTATSSPAPAKQARYHAVSSARSSRSKNMSSFSGGIHTSGCARIQSASEVVPHFAAPTMRKFGSLSATASRQLRGAPGRLEAALELVGQGVDGDAVLGQRVAVADRHRAVLERLVVDGHAE